MISRSRLFLVVVLCASLSMAAAPDSPANSPKDMLATGRVDEALRTLEQQATQSDSAESNNLLCRAYFSLEQWDRAIAACERATSQEPQKSLYHLWLGRAYGEKADRVSFFSAAGLAKKVRTEFERAVELDPGSIEARTDLAEFYLEAPGIVGGGKDKAQAQADALMKLNPGLAHWVMGRIAEKNKDLDAAEKEYRATIAVNHGGAHAWLNLALFYRHLKRYDDMEQTLRTMEKQPIDRAESLTDGASIILRNGRDYALGTRLVQKYLESKTVEESPVFKARELLGELLEKQGDKKAAAEQYKAALTLAKDYSKARESLKRVQ